MSTTTLLILIVTIILFFVMIWAFAHGFIISMFLSGVACVYFLFAFGRSWSEDKRASGIENEPTAIVDTVYARRVVVDTVYVTDTIYLENNAFKFKEDEQNIL